MSFPSVGLIVGLAIHSVAVCEGQEKYRPVDLFVFAGQSNMVGADADPAKLPADPNDDRVLFWWSVGDPPADAHDSTSGGQWKTLQIQPLGNPKPRDGASRQWGNFTSPEGGFGPEIGFARTRMSQLSSGNDPAFAILKVAYSGTSVEDDWDPRQSHRPGNCYGELCRQFRAASEAATDRGIRFRVAGLFWVQGESDSDLPRREWYQNRLTGMIAAAREDLGNPKLPVLLAINTRFRGPDDPGVRSIVAIQEAIAGADANCLYVDTSNATVANRVHFDAEGTIQVGRQFAEAYQDLQGAAEVPDRLP